MSPRIDSLMLQEDKFALRLNGENIVIFSALSLTQNFDWDSYEMFCDSSTSITSFKCSVSYVRCLEAFFKGPKPYLQELELILWKSGN